MATVQQVTDRATRMLARRLSQYRGKSNFEAVLRIFGAEIQELEDATWELQSFVGRNVNAASGHLLTLFGKLVGEPYGNSANDFEYRLRIRARIKANRSRGTAEDVYAVFAALLGAVTMQTATLTYEPGYPAAFVLRISDYSLVSTLVATFARFLYDSKAAGVYAVLEFYEGTETQALRFEQACYVNGTHAIGSTSLTVMPNTDGFPDAGDITIDIGTAGQESRSYTGRTTYELTGLAPTTFEHLTGAVVAWDDSPGLGLGEHTDPDEGGYLAGARGV